MPVADHFQASRVTTRRYDDRGTTASTEGTSEVIYPRHTLVQGEICEICYVYCTNQTELWKHVRYKHDTDQRLTCPKSGCGRRFSTLAMSAVHIKAHHREPGDKPLACELCGSVLGNIRSFWRHTTKKHPDAVAAMCGVCYMYMGDVPTLIDHVRRQHCPAPGTSFEVGETIPATGTKNTAGGNASAIKRRSKCSGRVYKGNYRNWYKVVHSSPKPAKSGGTSESTEVIRHQYSPVPHEHDAETNLEPVPGPSGTNVTVETIRAVGSSSAGKHCGGRVYNGNYRNWHKERIVCDPAEFNPWSPSVVHSSPKPTKSGGTSESTEVIRHQYSPVPHEHDAETNLEPVPGPSGTNVAVEAVPAVGRFSAGKHCGGRVYNGNYRNWYKDRVVCDPAEFNPWSPSVVHSSPKPAKSGEKSTVLYEHGAGLEAVPGPSGVIKISGAIGATGISAMTGTVPTLIQHMKQTRHVIRCDVCGKQYGNYLHMHKHRVVHGAVEFDPRSPFVARSFPKVHKSKKMVPY